MAATAVVLLLWCLPGERGGRGRKLRSLRFSPGSLGGHSPLDARKRHVASLSDPESRATHAAVMQELTASDLAPPGGRSTLPSNSSDPLEQVSDRGACTSCCRRNPPTCLFCPLIFPLLLRQDRECSGCLAVDFPCSLSGRQTRVWLLHFT